jgi:hypothetical protein
MPFEQCQKAEILLVELQNGRNSRELVEFHAAAAVFPMSHRLRLDAEFGRDRGLSQSQRDPALPDEAGHTSVIQFIHGF